MLKLITSLRINYLMSDQRRKDTFEELLRDIRSDLDNFKNLHSILLGKVRNITPDADIARWIFDVYLDKLYEIEAKLKKIAKDLNTHVNNASTSVNNAAEYARHVAYGDFYINDTLSELIRFVNDFIKYSEWDLVNMRRTLWQRDWQDLDKIKPVEYVSLERRKYVTAREELEKAKRNFKDHPEDVMNHLRTAIDLAIKERFEFKEIPRMIKFIDQAEKLQFPLPSYDLIYTYFNEGTERIHEGKIHTSFEALEVIRTVSNFIDALEALEITKDKIDEFVKSCGCVKV